MYARKLEEAKAWRHLDAFWSGSSLGRPALSLWTPNPGHTPAPYPTASLDRKSLDLDAAYLAHRTRDCLLGAVYLAEAFPFTAVDPGGSLALTALAAGGDYDFHGDSAWIHVREGLLEGPPPRQADPEVLRTYAACVAACARAAEGLGFVSTSTLMDPLTALSQMAGPEELGIALCERPGSVKAWVEALTDIWLELLRTCAGASRATASAVFWGPVTRGMSACLQCDYAVMVSPDMFDAFVRPSLVRMASAMGNTLYHLDGTAQMRFLDSLQQIPTCRGIQWNPETDYFRPTRHLDALQEIRSRGLLLYVQVETVEEAVATVRAVGPDGLFVKFRRCFATVEDAAAAIRELELASR